MWLQFVVILWGILFPSLELPNQCSFFSRQLYISLHDSSSYHAIFHFLKYWFYFSYQMKKSLFQRARFHCVWFGGACHSPPLPFRFLVSAARLRAPRDSHASSTRQPIPGTALPWPDNGSEITRRSRLFGPLPAMARRVAGETRGILTLHNTLTVLRSS